MNRRKFLLGAAGVAGLAALPAAVVEAASESATARLEVGLHVLVDLEPPGGGDVLALALGDRDVEFDGRNYVALGGVGAFVGGTLDHGRAAMDEFEMVMPGRLAAFAEQLSVGSTARIWIAAAESPGGFLWTPVCVFTGTVSAYRIAWGGDPAAGARVRLMFPRQRLDDLAEPWGGA